jgi:protein involved in polysaccharide export with SLBB domain
MIAAWADRGGRVSAGTIGRALLRSRRRALLAGLVIGLGCVPTLRAQARPGAGNDLQEGDRIVLRFDGDPILNDTFVVSRGPALQLPVVGTVSLAGVRRDSIESVLSAAIGKYYRNPIVHAHALVRIAVFGEVVRPGYYAVPTDMLVPDVVMVAGGPTPLAQIDGLKITRLGAPLMARDSTQNAIAHGLTISQLGVRSEDQFVVPKVADSERTIRIVAELITIPIAILSIVLLSKGK